MRRRKAFPSWLTREQSAGRRPLDLRGLLVAPPRSRRPENFIHVGAHKTGTSTLQSLIRENGPELLAQGILPIARVLPIVEGLERPLDNEADLIRPLRSLAKRPSEKHRRHLKRMLSAMGRAAPSMLLSDEAFLGHRIGSTRGFYPHAEAMLATLVSVLPKRRTRVILYVRHQDRLIESNYLHSVKLGSAETFPGFLQRIDLDAMSWLDLAGRLAGIVGGENLIVRPFEPIAQGVVPFAREFFSLFCDPARLNLREIQANPSLSAPGVFLARLLGPRIPASAWYYLRQGIQLTMSHRILPPARLLSDAARKRLRARYQDDYDEVLRLYPGPSAAKQPPEPPSP